MTSQISSMMWARIGRRVNELVDLGLKPIEVLEILDRAIKEQQEKGETPWRLK